jgi:uncharacterized protein YkwD
MAHRNPATGPRASLRASCARRSGGCILRRNHRVLAATFAAAAALAIATVAPAVSARGATAAKPTSDAYEARIFSLMNAERRRHGLRPLRRGSCAGSYAERWSGQLARKQKLHHQSLRPLLKSCGARRAAENIGYGNVSAEALMKQWMESSRHRANILDPRLSYVGVGAARSKSGHWYAVQDFLGF